MKESVLAGLPPRESLPAPKGDPPQQENIRERAPISEADREGAEGVENLQSRDRYQQQGGHPEQPAAQRGPSWREFLVHCFELDPAHRPFPSIQTVPRFATRAFSCTWNEAVD